LLLLQLLSIVRTDGSFLLFFLAIFLLLVALFRMARSAVLPPVSQHGVFQREAARADVALVGPLPAVGPHVTPEVFRRPETAQAKGANDLMDIKSNQINN
jgi:hypothetical protein